MSDSLLALIIVLIVVAGIVIIAAMVINAVVKVKLAKYDSLRPDEKPQKAQEGVWPPPPSA